MAVWAKFSDAVIASAPANSRSNESAIAALACNMALNEVWKKHDWRESLADFPAFYVAPLTQDYGPPAVSVPADFLGIRKATFWDMYCANTGGVGYERQLDVIANLPLTDFIQLPSSICYFPPTRSFRIHPRMPGGYGAPWRMIDGQYKKKPTVTYAQPVTGALTTNRITASQIANIYLPFDDMYLQVWIEALKWAFLVLANDPKAGGTQVQNGMTSHYGQFAQMIAMIDDMAKTEAEEIGNQASAPRTPLVGGAVGGYGFGNGYL